MFRFEKLEVWKMSIEYAKKIYSICDQLPRNEEFGLKSQLKRAALSISSNIAEGSASSSNKDFCNFLDIAIKSTIETVSQLFFAKEMNYINNQIVKDLYSEAEILVKKLYALKDYIKTKNK